MLAAKKYGVFLEAVGGALDQEQQQRRLALGSRGLSDALDRLSQLEGRDEAGAQVAAGEALLWIAALDEQRGRIAHPVLVGLRFARDRVAHNLAEVLLDFTSLVTWGGQPVIWGGERVTMGGQPAVPDALRWANRSDLPPPGKGHNDPRKIEAYDRHIAGQPVLATLETAQQVLATTQPASS